MTSRLGEKVCDMGSSRVLIVEDEHIVGEDLKRTLEGFGYEVPGVVSTGEEAFRGCCDLRPDAILMDIMLQGELDGIETAERIRSSLDIPIIFLTAYSDASFLERAMLTSPFGFLIKPISGEELRSTIETALHRHRIERKTVIELQQGVRDRAEQLAAINVKLREEIRERKRTEEKLRESEARFRAVFESTSDCILVWDRHYNYLYANQAAIDHVGATRDKVIGKTIVDGLGHVPDFMRLWTERVDTVFATGRSMRVEDAVRLGDRLVHSESVLFPIRDQESNTLAVGVVYRDVTERKKAEEALRTSEERMRLLIESAPIGVKIVSHGACVYANPALAAMFEYDTPEEIRTIGVENLYAPEERDLVRTLLLNKPEPPQHVESHAVKGIRKSGQSFDLTAWITHTEYAGAPAALWFMADVSKEKSLATQLMRAQKMEAMGALAGGVSHDFNNLLTIIQGYSELLLMGGTLTDSDRSDLQKIAHAAARGAELAHRLLTFSRKVEPRFQPVDLNEHIEQVCTLLSRTIPKMIDIRLALDADPSTTYADPGQIEQVLMNLAVNARDAMPGGGTLTFETRRTCVDGKGEIRRPGVEPGEYILIVVSDTGHGMSPHVRERIFEPFFTTKERGEGTGLGLATVFGIVTGHRGFIDCESEPGKGTRFFLYLPAMEKGNQADETPRSETFVNGTETILVVDDEKSVRDLARKILEKAGYRVLTVPSGTQALKAYKNLNNRISLVILDLMMPGMGGMRCLEELRGIDPEARILIATGLDDIAAEEAIRAGAKASIKKPYRGADILEAVRGVIDRGD